MPYRVFVSYSWSNSAERRALEAELVKVQGVSILTDRQFIKPGDQIHDRINQMIDASECVIVMLTSEGLKSAEVRDEISRSHDREKKIVPVVAEGTTLEELPWYLRDTHFIKYREREFDRVVESIIEFVGSLANPQSGFDRSKFPPAIITQLDAGARFIPLREGHFNSLAYPLSEYLICELAMRQSDAVIVFAAHPKLTVELAATALARDLLPHLDHLDYVWLLVRDNNPIPGYLTLETANLRSGDRLLLLGNHRMPSWAPAPPPLRRK